MCESREDKIVSLYEKGFTAEEILYHLGIEETDIIYSLISQNAKLEKGYFIIDSKLNYTEKL